MNQYIESKLRELLRYPIHREENVIAFVEALLTNPNGEITKAKAEEIIRKEEQLIEIEATKVKLSDELTELKK